MLQTLEEQIANAKWERSSTAIKKWIRESIKTKESLWRAEWMQRQIHLVADTIVESLRKGGKVLVCGNGGSASDAAHFVAEFNNQLSLRRTYALPAIDLTAMSSTITAIANDYCYDYIFQKQVEGLGKAGDVLVAISTSGSSGNVIHALYAAKLKDMTSVLLTGKYRSEYVVSVMENLNTNEVCKTIAQPDYVINVDSDYTPIIQESHIMILHILVGLVDYALTGKFYLDKE